MEYCDPELTVDLVFVASSQVSEVRAVFGDCRTQTQNAAKPAQHIPKTPSLTLAILYRSFTLHPTGQLHL